VGILGSEFPECVNVRPRPDEFLVRNDRRGKESTCAVKCSHRFKWNVCRENVHFIDDVP
jgi:hypothetical protein